MACTTAEYQSQPATLMQLLFLLNLLLLPPSPGLLFPHYNSMTSSNLSASPSSWDAFCLEYEKRVEPFTSQFAEEMIARLSGHESKTKQKLLDVGCGTGAVALLGISQGWDVAVTDVSEAMVERTRERISAQLPEKSKLIDNQIVDGRNLPDRWSSSFDLAMANFSVIFFPQPVDGLKEIFRCLVPGTGRVAFTAWGSPSETPAFCVFKDVLLEMHPELVDGNRPKRITGSVQVLEDLLKEAGFVDVTVEGPIFKTLVVKNASEYYNRFALTSPPTAATLEKMDLETRQAFRKRVMDVAIARGGREDGSIALDSGAFIAYGRKPSILHSE